MVVLRTATILATNVKSLRRLHDGSPQPRGVNAVRVSLHLGSVVGSSGLKGLRPYLRLLVHYLWSRLTSASPATAVRRASMHHVLNQRVRHPIVRRHPFKRPPPSESWTVARKRCCEEAKTDGLICILGKVLTVALKAFARGDLAQKWYLPEPPLAALNSKCDTSARLAAGLSPGRQYRVTVLGMDTHLLIDVQKAAETAH